jgi:hypothetical protein
MVEENAAALLRSWHEYYDYSGSGIAGTMPGSGLFRATQELIAEEAVNIGLQHIGSFCRPA